MAEPFVRKFKDGHFWVLRIKLLDRRWVNYNSRIPVEFDRDGEPTNLKKARAARDKIQASESRGERPLESEHCARGHGFAHVAQQYYESRADLWVPKNQQNNREYVAGLSRYFADRDVRLVGDDLIRSFRVEWSKTRSNATVNNYLTCLFAVLAFAKKELKLDVTYRRVFLPVHERQDDYLSEEELARVFEAANRVTLKGVGIRDFIEFAALTGMRLGEILACKSSWIHGDIIRIPAWEERGKRKVRVTKNGKSRRVPITERLRRLIDGRQADGLLFPGYSTEVSRKFQVALREAGIERHLKFHNLRDTFAVMALTRGIPPQVVTKIVGDNLEVLMRHYAAVNNRDLVALMNRAFASDLLQD